MFNVFASNNTSKTNSNSNSIAQKSGIIGTYRSKYTSEQPPSKELTSIVYPWMQYPPVCITARQEVLHLSVTQLRVEDYYLIRKNKLKHGHANKLEDAIKNKSFNQKLMKVNCYSLFRFSDEREFEFSTIEKLGRKQSNEYTGKVFKGHQRRINAPSRIFSQNTTLGSNNFNNTSNNNNNYNNNSKYHSSSSNSISSGGNNSSNIFNHNNNTTNNNRSNNYNSGNSINIFSKNNPYNTTQNNKKCNTNSSNNIFNNDKSNQNNNIFHHGNNNFNSSNIFRNPNQNKGYNTKIFNNNDDNLFNNSNIFNRTNNFFNNRNNSNQIFNSSYGGNNIFNDQTIGSNIFAPSPVIIDFLFLEELKTCMMNINDVLIQLKDSLPQCHSVNSRQPIISIECRKNHINSNLQEKKKEETSLPTQKPIEKNCQEKSSGNPIPYQPGKNIFANDIFPKTLNNAQSSNSQSKPSQLNNQKLLSNPKSQTNFVPSNNVNIFKPLPLLQKQKFLSQNSFNPKPLSNPQPSQQNIPLIFSGQRQLEKTSNINVTLHQNSNLFKKQSVQLCDCRFKLQIVWQDLEAIRLGKKIDQTLQLNQVDLQDSQWQKLVIRELKKKHTFVRSNAQLKIKANKPQKLSSGRFYYMIVGTLTQKVFNIEGYKIHFQKISNGYVSGLVISNEHGSVAWNSLVELAKIDLHQNQFHANFNKIFLSLPYSMNSLESNKEVGIISFQDQPDTNKPEILEEKEESEENEEDQINSL